MVIDMYEWSDGLLGTKPEDIGHAHRLTVSYTDFQILTQYLGKNRSRIVPYRGFMITNDDKALTNNFLKFIGKL